MLKICRTRCCNHLKILNANRNITGFVMLDHRDWATHKNLHWHFMLKRSASTEVVQHTWYTGVWQALSNSTPVAYMQQGLIELHEFTGLPWWGTIVLSTVVLRSIVTLPLTVYQHDITARIEKIALEMPPIVEELKKEAAIAMKKFKWTEQQTRAVYQRSLRKQWNILIVRENCHPAKSFIVLWAQIPLWIFQSVAIRNLVYMLPDPTSIDAKLIFTELTIGGFSWIPNLTEVDSSYILPVALGLINLGIIELQMILRTKPPKRFQRIVTNVFRGLSLLMIPVASSVPSALCVYWVASSTFGLAQNLLIATPSVRRAFGIPQTKSELLNPYERIWTTMKIRTGHMEAAVSTAATNSSPSVGLKESCTNKINKPKDVEKPKLFSAFKKKP